MCILSICVLIANCSINKTYTAIFHSIYMILTKGVVIVIHLINFQDCLTENFKKTEITNKLKYVNFKLRNIFLGYHYN